jgi:TolB protein
MSQPLERSVAMAAGAFACCLMPALAATARAQARVEFEGETNVGDVAQKGASRFDAARNEYTLVGGGRNMWDEKDAFHFLWRKASGDLGLSAEVRFAEKSGEEHRKGGWVVRQSLEAASPYADAIVHADGLISLQYRLTKGGETLEIQSPFKAPAAVRLERTGDLFTLFVAPDGKSFRPVGGVLVPMKDPVYAGLAMCSHDPARTASAVFSKLAYANPGVAPLEERVLESSLEVVNVESGEREAVYVTRDHIEAPNWSRDGRSFLFNSGGRLYDLPRAGGTPRLFDTGSADHLNNDHGLSFDGRWLAISHEPEEDSLVYVLPGTGGTPRQVTALGPSYWHGWSPDGKTLVYCAARNDEYDVYAIAADAEKSTDERRLTTAPGLDDGPDFSPDGRTIYFNSVRTGQMRIWRMEPDGSNQRQLTFDDAYGDWFPHPSPDGRWIVFLSFDSSVEGHPPNKEVALRIMPTAGGEPRVLARLFGGQGTINVPSWSPDSSSVAFVSYRLVKP